ncbi:melanoma-associated antigen 8 [Dorcoceras hygrometricum]|uniref:Melanoma-associated antigen 8 n=1 Tax=Dorcoceras hygrometricum TaxID=472368 RepID=A0A2Z7CWJ7_9LAMI|nr:melanoma-associated antigen 8 [Dorcoceras hygrometricum]
MASENFSDFDISEHEKDKLVGEVIRYILFKSEQNSGCPIKRDELTQLITSKNYRQRNLPAFVINEAKAKLSSIFGYEMRELQRSRPSVSGNPGRVSQSQQVISDAKSYIIVSQLPADVYKRFVEDTNSTHLTGFAFVVVSIIHLAGGKVAEENLWHHLKRMGLQENQENHPNFGNTKQALEALVQQRYLQKEKVNGPEGNTVYYELAERALDASINDKIKEYISQIPTGFSWQIVQKDGNPMEAD